MNDLDLDADLVRRLRDAVPGTDTPALDELVAAALQRPGGDDLVDVAWAVADTPIGPLTLAATAAGLVRVSFAGEDAVLDGLARAVSPRVVRLPSRLDRARRQLDEYFAGRRRRFELDVDWRLSRGFRRAVLAWLAEGVPYGATVTYGELARQAGSPGASRAVGTAMATNPLPIVVPCHRVLRTGGALGGYGGGLPTKRFLLRLEGVMA